MSDEALWQALDRQRSAVADLLDTLTAEQWAHPTLCPDWTVRDIAAHLAMGPRFGVPATLGAVVRARGSFNRMIHDSAVRYAARPTDGIVGELRAVVGLRRLAVGQRLKDALMDVLVHEQDIAIPLGLHRPMPADAARVSAEHLWRIGFPFHARRNLRGLRLTATDVDWSAGEGAQVTGPIDALLPLLAGRTATLDRLSGDGVRVLHRA